MTKRSNIRTMTLFPLAAFVAASAIVTIDAFSMPPTVATTKAATTAPSSSTTAISWSMQMPDYIAFPKSTWYNEVANPTARRIVYDDGPGSEFELMFATAGNNWPDFNDNMSEEGGEDEVESTKQPQRIIWNPIRRARNLIKRIL